MNWIYNTQLISSIGLIIITIHAFRHSKIQPQHMKHDFFFLFDFTSNLCLKNGLLLFGKLCILLLFFYGFFSANDCIQLHREDTFKIFEIPSAYKHQVLRERKWKLMDSAISTTAKRKFRFHSAIWFLINRVMRVFGCNIWIISFQVIIWMWWGKAAIDSKFLKGKMFSSFFLVVVLRYKHLLCLI